MHASSIVLYVFMSRFLSIDQCRWRCQNFQNNLLKLKTMHFSYRRPRKNSPIYLIKNSNVHDVPWKIRIRWLTSDVNGREITMKIYQTRTLSPWIFLEFYNFLFHLFRPIQFLMTSHYICSWRCVNFLWRFSTEKLNNRYNEIIMYRDIRK